jgi:hypothetical protein
MSTNKKRDRKLVDNDNSEVPCMENPFFERMAKAALDGECSVEFLLGLCQKYGKLHGESLRKRVENNSSYSKVYSSSRRQVRSHNDVADGSVQNKEVQDVSGHSRSTSSLNLYSHPFYRTYHSGKPFVSALTEAKEPPNEDRESSSHSKIESEGTKVQAKRPRICTSENSNEEVAGNEFVESSISKNPEVMTQKPTAILVEGMKGVEMITVSSSSYRYLAFLTILGRRIDIGEFPRDREAALAHDRTLMRAIGPAHCPQDQLNFPISSYAHDPLESFMRYDAILKRALSGTSWDGLKDCDFGFLLLQSFNKSVSKRKNAPSSSSTTSPHSISRRSSRSHAGDADAGSDNMNKTQDDASTQLQNNLKPSSLPDTGDASKIVNCGEDLCL